MTHVVVRSAIFAFAALCAALNASRVHAGIGTHHRADLEAVCWFVSAGLSLTGLVCALGYGGPSVRSWDHRDEIFPVAQAAVLSE
jgi:hypothetical protein